MIVADMGLLRHHVIDVPESRGFLIGGLPHTTAVVRERKGGQKWAIDGWTHAKRRIAGRPAVGAVAHPKLKTKTPALRRASS